MNFRKLLQPKPLPYDFAAWRKLPFPERARMVCQVWALQGFGAPPTVMLFYLLKIALYVWGWFVCCGFSETLGGLESIGEWWFKLEALGKAVLWTVLVEVLGWGGASGPLTARYVPPVGGATYWLVPGTIRSPVFTWLGDRRTIFDAVGYAALLGVLLYACCAPAVTPRTVVPVLVLLPLLGLRDRQIFLAARADVYYPALLVFLIPAETGGGLQITWFAIWFWAAFSKLTPTFTSVVAVMICNSPFLNLPWLKRKLFRKYPDDLRLSRTAVYLSHFGTMVEFSLPILLLLGILLGWPSAWMTAFLVGMTVFHAFIFFNFPMGVPMEWNVIMVYCGWVLFGTQPVYSPLQVDHPLLLTFLSISLVALPLLGNLFPRYISFLLSMRYYAGTWPFSVWLLKKGVKVEKVDPNVRKTSPDLRRQLRYFYDQTTTDSILSRAIAFRLMHLPSRVLHDLLPQAVDDLDDYVWFDGEFMAGEMLGWNFGDGHLHQETLLRSLRKRCPFESGDVRVLMVESPQLHNGRMHWRIHDGRDGLLAEGYAHIKAMRERQPWPETK